MLLIFASVILMLIGLALMFGVVAGLVTGGAGVALLGFIVTMVGLVAGLRGIGQYLLPPNPPRLNARRQPR